MAGFRDMNIGDMLVIDGILCALVTSGGHRPTAQGERVGCGEAKRRVFLFYNFS